MGDHDEQGVSRRGFLKTTGLGLGVAVGALVLGPSAVSAAESGASTPVAEGPFPYKDLDPREGMLRGHAGYWKSGCAYGAFYGITSMLREAVGGPYAQVPYRMLAWGRGGGANWGTLCGALTGACAAINLVAADADVNKLVGELMGWYSTHPFPSDEATKLAVTGSFKQTAKDYPKIELIKTVSKSPSATSPTRLGSPPPDQAPRRPPEGALRPPHRRRRGQDRGHAQRLQGRHFRARLQSRRGTEICLACHEPDQEGKMSCVECHEPHEL